MRQELKRIETMLARLADQHQRESVASTPLPTVMTQTKIDTVAPPSTAKPIKTPLPPALSPRPSAPLAPAIAANAALNVLVQPVLADLQAVKTPTLPKIKASSVVKPPAITDPANAVTDMLKAVETVATRWQEALRQVLGQIQTVYQEGPIVDGWLEAYAADAEKPPIVQPMNASGALPDEGTSAIAVETPHDQRVHDATEAAANANGYRLCGLGENGQLWFRHCPAAQVPAVSLAIARHQSLKQLLIRKQNLELRLSKLAEALSMVYEHLDNQFGEN